MSLWHEPRSPLVETFPSTTASPAPWFRRTTPAFALVRRQPPAMVMEQNLFREPLFERTYEGHPYATVDFALIRAYDNPSPVLW